jgi:hypothetical protein
MEIEKQYKESMKQKLVFEKINKMNKLLAKLTKRKEDLNQ